MTRHRHIVLLLLLAGTAPLVCGSASANGESGSAAEDQSVELIATADALDSIYSSNGRIKLLSYDPDDIYLITTRVGYQTNLEFSENEEILTISVGDRSFWQIIPAGNRLFIRPQAEGVATNMTIITNRYSYQFDLKSADNDTQSIIYVARFVYPGEEEIFSLTDYSQTPYGVPIVQAPVMPVEIVSPQSAIPAQPGTTYSAAQTPIGAGPDALTSAAPPARREAPEDFLSQQGPLRAAAPPPKRNYLYTFSGPEEAAPYELFDNGQTTFFRFAHTLNNIPRVSIISPTNDLTALTPYKTDGYYAVDDIAAELLIYTENGNIHVYNELLSQ